MLWIFSSLDLEKSENSGIEGECRKFLETDGNA